MNTAIRLDDKYTAASSLAYMSGTHALVRPHMRRTLPNARTRTPSSRSMAVAE